MRTLAWLLCCSLIILAASCATSTGGGSATGLNLGEGQLPGVVGNLGSGSGSGGGGSLSYETTPPTMASEAPLGVNLAYQVELFGATETTETAHGASVVVEGTPPTGFRIIDLTMMLDGQAPNWDLTRGTFYEGDKIDLWIKYQCYNAMTIDRHWDSADIKLDFREVGLAQNAATYSVKLDYAIPYDSAKTDAIFKFDLTSDGVNKVSDPFPYDILVRPGATNVTYPEGGDGDNSVPGYGQGWAQMIAEDLLTNSDFDYNDFVGRLRATEYRDASGNLSQIKMTVKAIARGAGYDSDWQLNFGAAFPGATAFAVVQQYYANGTKHGNQRYWKSTNGLSVPVFTPLRGALPAPPTSFATNTVAGTKYMDGDYAEILVFFNSPVQAGTYTAIPYEPELRVQPSGGGQPYTVSWWNNPGDQTDATGNPLAFTVPDTFAWPLEYQRIWTVYPGFIQWAFWVNSPNAGNTNDPNTYLVSQTLTPETSGSQFSGTPQTKSYWQGSSGQNEFHEASPSGQLNTSNLIRYLNGDGTQTNNSRSKVVLNPLKTSKSYFGSNLPLPTSNINNGSNTSSGYSRLDSYLTGATSGSVVEYRLGAELITLALNVERGRISGTEWTYIPELREIRAVVSDPLIPGKQGVIAAANAAFALPTNAANDAIKQRWFLVCQRLNANTYFVEDQPKPAPTQNWYDSTPSGNFFQRAQFTN
jgi:hypothetical protein